MYWSLAIDFGTSFTCAATASAGRRTVLPIAGAEVIASAVYHTGNTIEVGDTAFLQALRDPASAELGLKARIADVACPPVLLGEGRTQRAFNPVELLGELLKRIADTATDAHRNVLPSAVVLTHPASWSPDAVLRLRNAADNAEIPATATLVEPAAAAQHLARKHSVAAGTTFAVLDIGAGTCDVALLSATDAGYVPHGGAIGLDWLGGRFLDAKLLSMLRRELDKCDPAAWRELTASDVRDSQRVRRFDRLTMVDVVDAKHRLSSSDLVNVVIPGTDAVLTVRRRTFEQEIRPDLAQAVDLISQTARRAGVDPATLDVVMLAGGSSRVPLLAELIGAQLPVRVVTAEDGKEAVALGALVGQPGSEGDPSPPRGFRPIQRNSAIRPLSRPDPERTIHLLGDITVTQTSAVTPTGLIRLRSARWTVLTVWEPERTTRPLWLIAVAILLAIPTTLFSLLLLVYRRRVVKGAVHIEVTDGQVRHAVQIPVTTPAQAQQWERLVGGLNQFGSIQ